MSTTTGKIYAEGGDSGRKMIFEVEVAPELIQNKYLPQYKGKIYNRTGKMVELKSLRLQDTIGIIDRASPVIIDGFYGEAYVISPEAEKKLIESDQKKKETEKIMKTTVKSDPLPPGMGRCWECGRIVPLSELDEDGYCGC